MERLQIALLGAVFLFFSFGIGAEEFEDPVARSKWKVRVTPLNCMLEHEIPNLGTATISQNSGYPQSFNLHLFIPRSQKGTAKVVMVPDHWKRDQRRYQIGQFSVKPAHDAITFEKEKSRDLLSGLSQGFKALIYIKPAQSSVGGASDMISISSVGFQKAYKEYLKCINNLIPYTFEQIKKSTVHFESGSSVLSKEVEAKLEEVAKYIKTDGKIRLVKLFGYSDSKGGFQANKQLSNERMWAVKDYLVMKHGISADIFKLKDFADKNAIASNKTQTGRAKNRRVVIELYR